MLNSLDKIVDWLERNELKVMVAVWLTIFAVGCSYVNKKMGYTDDWIGEEFLEEVIEVKTGIDIDLTPTSPE